MITDEDYERIALALLSIRPEQWDEWEKRKAILLEEQAQREKKES
jgi:hypothetical protein